MHLIEHFHGHTVIHRLDPRLRVIAAFAFSLVVAVCQQPLTALLGLAASVAALAAARLPWHAISGRVKELNIFMALIVAITPFSTPGEPIFQLWWLSYTWQGLVFAGVIALKGNAIVLMLTALLSTMEAVTLGHALDHLKVPTKLIHLLLFTVRYVDVLHHEYIRLRQAMKARCFKAGMNNHTYRSLGHLVAVLLIRSFDRSERILNAMKCRGFKGQFWLLEHFHASGRDTAFALIGLAVLAGLTSVELML